MSKQTNAEKRETFRMPSQIDRVLEVVREDDSFWLLADRKRIVN